MLSAELAVLAYLLFWPVFIDPVAWQPAANPRMAPNDRLIGVWSLPDVGPGPESVAIGRDGRLYTGLQDGRVVRLFANGSLGILPGRGVGIIGAWFAAGIWRIGSDFATVARRVVATQANPVCL